MVKYYKPRVPEPDLVVPAVKIMAEEPNGRISTSRLIRKLREHFRPGGQDTEIIDNRTDDYFSQKVRNLASHKTLEKLGLADKVYRGFKLTNKGWQKAGGNTKSG